VQARNDEVVIEELGNFLTALKYISHLATYSRDNRPLDNRKIRLPLLSGIAVS